MSPIEITFASVLMAMVAGFASIASPCVLPIVPIIVTGTSTDHKHRPLLIVIGLSISFIAMGVVTSIFAGAVAGFMPIMEKAAGVLIIVFGLFMLLGINIFKKLTFLYKFQIESKGRWSGLILGLTLGIVWIPCVGPMLSGVLALVATSGKLLSGLVLLTFYSLGFAIPILLAGYASQSMRQKIRMMNQHPLTIRFISGILLIVFGIYILNSGMLGIGFFF